MKRRPVILITPSTDDRGTEFGDQSISLSNNYSDAIIAAGGLPQIFPATTSKAIMREAVHRCDGVLMTGGDDIDPKLYAKNLPRGLAKKVGPLAPARDIWEPGLIAEIFSQKKPLFGICRGHQMLNVALGGTLLVDIPSQRPQALNHSRMDRKTVPVHEVTIEPESFLGKITKRKALGVNSTHHQAIGELAPTLRVVATAADGIIEAVELKDPARRPFLLGVQFHPERLLDSDGVFLRLFTQFIQACGPRRSSL
jgi:putative glutamine amidotransferase